MSDNLDSQDVRNTIPKSEAAFTRTPASESVKARVKATKKEVIRAFVLSHASGLRVTNEVVLWLRRLIGESREELDWDFMLKHALGSSNLKVFQADLQSSPWSPGLSQFGRMRSIPSATSVKGIGYILQFLKIATGPFEFALAVCAMDVTEQEAST